MTSIYIDVNRLNALKGDDKNSWELALNETLSLPAGTQVQLQNSFINQKGLLGDSIEIEEDITETVHCNVYMTEDIHILPDQVPFKQRDNPKIYLPFFRIYNFSGLCAAGTPIEYLDSLRGAGNTTTDTSVGLPFGGSGTPMILYNCSDDGSGNFIMSPTVVERSFTIKKGIYGINQIAELIQDQINGKIRLDRNNEYILTSTISDNIASGVYNGDVTENTGLSVNLNLANGGVYNQDDTMNGSLNPHVDGTFTQIFIPNHEHQALVEANPNTKIKEDYSTYFTTNDKAFGVLMDNQRARDATNETTDEYNNVTNYQLGKIGYKVGATEFKISYSPDRNGFSFQHLHQVYRPPTHDFLCNPISNAGTEAIGIRNFFREFNDPFPDNPASGGNHAESARNMRSSILRPRSRIGGSIIHNFAVATAKRLGDIKNLEAGGNYLFNNYFSNETKAKKAWEECIWARLGFSYEQLNSQSHFERTKSYNLPESRIQGITTDANIDGTLLATIAGQVNPMKATPTLGAGRGTTGEVIMNIQTFNQIDIGTPRKSIEAQYPDVSKRLYNNIDQYVGSINHGFTTMVQVTTTDRPLVARNLPKLSIYGYYLITSSIVPNSDDIVQKGSPLPLLGVVPKSSLSNQDFISSDNEIVHTLLNPINLNSIKVSVLNPDLTAPFLEDNSSVILRITYPE